jgi:hypothetical protein
MPTASEIHVDVDSPRHRAIITVPPHLSGARVARALAAQLAKDVQLASLDWVVDLTANGEGATNADTEELARTYLGCPRDSRVKFTCVVISDPYFDLWAPAIDLQFSDRQHRAFPTVASAIRFLDAATPT